MTDRYSPYPADEPVIGGPYPPSAPVSTYPDDGGYIGAGAYQDDPAAEWDDEYAGDYDDDDGFAGYYDDAPARQPMFYVFIALAALVGGIMIFLLFSLVNRGGDDASPSGSVKFNVRIDSPAKDRRIEIGKPEDVIVQATSTEPIVRFDLYIQDKLADTMDVTQASPDNKYRATLKAQFDRKGEYTLFVKVTSASNATQESDKVRVIAIEPVGDRPTSINGKVVATVNLRTGPGENFDQVGTLTEGKVVKIIGRTANNEWVLVDVDGGRWVKATALEPQDSLALVPIRQVTPTPVPATNTPLPQPTASATPSASPTANPKLPDLAPTGAVLIDGGTKLRVTVTNLSANVYTGALRLIVDVSGSKDDEVFNVNIPGNGSTTLNVSLAVAVTKNATATVKVDPDNAIKETNKDNNTQVFGLTPAVEQPNLTIASVDTAGNITVRVVNQGGALPASTVTVKVTVAGSGAEQSKQQLELANGRDATFTLLKPGAGDGKIEVLINGQVVASKNVTLP